MSFYRKPNRKQWQRIMTYSTQELHWTKLFEKNKTKGEKKQPWWKRRLESQVKELNKDLGRLNALLECKKMKKNHQDNLQKTKSKGEDIAKKTNRRLLR